MYTADQIKEIRKESARVGSWSWVFKRSENLYVFLDRKDNDVKLFDSYYEGVDFANKNPHLNNNEYYKVKNDIPF